MNEENDDDEENLLDYNVTVDEIKTVITKDFTDAKNDNQKDVEATKTYISSLMKKCDFLNLYPSQEEEQDDIADENVHEQDDEDDDISKFSAALSITEKNSPSGIQKILRKSLTVFEEKAKVDMQVVHFLDQEEIRESSSGMQNLLRETLEKTIKKGQRHTKKQIESNKVTFEGTVKEIAAANSIGSLSDADVVVGSLIREFAEKSATIFDETNRNIQESTKAVKSDFSEYIRTIFPLPQVTEEEIRSEEFVKNDILYWRNSIANDIEERKNITDSSITETKTRISLIPGQILDGVKNIPKLPMKLLQNGNFENNEEGQSDFIEDMNDENQAVKQNFTIHPPLNGDVLEENNEN